MIFASRKVRKKTVRQTILLIISLVHYWSGKVKHPVSSMTAMWPKDPNILPISSWHPDEDVAEHPVEEDTGMQIVPYAG